MKRLLNLRRFRFKRIEEKNFYDCPSFLLMSQLWKKLKLAQWYLNIKWTDIGSWKSLWEYEKKNEKGNVVEGKVFE